GSDGTVVGCGSGWWFPRHGDDGVVLRWMELGSASNNGGLGLGLRRRWAASPGWEAQRARWSSGAACARCDVGEDSGGCDQRAKVQG
ncbi:hypothetical protein U1Q18_044416, partial [Sarracenia purpurea var. burkii]